MDNPKLADFINQVFKDKPQDKRKQWIQILEDEEFENLNDLKQLNEESWSMLKLPVSIKDTLKKGITDNSNSTLSAQEKDLIISLINKEMPAEEIMSTLKIKKDSKKEQLVTTLYQSLVSPPKPLPTNCKLLHAKTIGVQLPLYHYTQKQDPLKKYYTFLVIGETGSGKTTLLDAFVNYLTGMSYSDNWRWKLVDENQFKNKHSSQSQTTNISIYYVNDHKNRFNIRIIDTPGFGDTQGIEKDQETVKQFEKLFKEIKEVDYVLITTQSSKTRLTPGTKYIYDRVQEIFGKDAIERFVLMCTFADGDVPIVTVTLSEYLKFGKYFTFNNSALYTPQHKGNSQTKFFWKMAMASIEQFSQFVIEQNRLPLSLELSKQVLEHREYLLVSIQTSQQMINDGFIQLEETKKLLELIKKHQKAIDENGSFQYTHYEERYERKALENVYQMCTKCNKTCCQVCKWPNNATESACTYFNGGKGCPCCNGCPKSAHVRSQDEITIVKIPVIKEFTHKKQAFEEGQAGLRNSEQAMQQQKQVLQNLSQQILALMKRVKENIAKLDEIAMKPRLFTDEDYFQQMIKHEEDNKNPGWSDRVKQLEKMLTYAKNTQLICNSNKVQDLFPQYQKLIEENNQCSIF